MKKWFIVSLLALVVCNVKAQSVIAEKDWTELIGNLTKEQWQQANKLSEAYLKKIPVEAIEDTEASVLRYMYILSTSGLMNTRKFSKEEGLKKVAMFKGHKIVLPSHPITLKTGFNSVQLVDSKPDSLMITATNLKATEIYSFEYIIPKKPMTLEEFKNAEGKMCRVEGLLQSIKVEGSIFPRFKIFIDDAYLIIE
ncbi:hypothetical protein FFF34_015490 [Inquilinus sp. KBS0705]|nr:hypothetical protein FFF34_015490 [Inquilinus sp. KBS0705]